MMVMQSCIITQESHHIKTIRKNMPRVNATTSQHIRTLEFQKLPKPATLRDAPYSRSLMARALSNSSFCFWMFPKRS